MEVFEVYQELGLGGRVVCLGRVGLVRVGIVGGRVVRPSLFGFSVLYSGTSERSRLLKLVSERFFGS